MTRTVVRHSFWCFFRLSFSPCNSVSVALLALLGVDGAERVNLFAFCVCAVLPVRRARSSLVAQQTAAHYHTARDGFSQSLQGVLLVSCSCFTRRKDQCDFDP